MSGGGGFVADADAVQHHVLGEVEQILGRHVIAAVDHGAGARGIDQGETGARAAAEVEVLGFARAADQFHAVLHEDPADQIPRLECG